MRRDLKEKIERQLKDGETLSDHNKCFSIAWDWVFQGTSSIGTARELWTCVNAHNIMATFNREKSYTIDILGKPMHDVISLSITLCRKIEEDRITSEELKLAGGIMPALHWGKKSLEEDENFIKRRNVSNIIDDASEGIGPFINDNDRWFCCRCRSELWCLYVIRSSNETGDSNLCIKCVASVQKAKTEKNTYRRRMALDQQSFDQTIKTLQHKVGPKKYWWYSNDGFLSNEYLSKTSKEQSKNSKGNKTE